MANISLIAIPIITRIIVGIGLTFFPESDKEEKLLTTSKLIENGSHPFWVNLMHPLQF